MNNVVTDMTGSFHTLCLVYSSVKIYATGMVTLSWLIFLIPTKKGWNNVLCGISEVILQENAVLKTDAVFCAFMLGARPFCKLLYILCFLQGQNFFNRPLSGCSVPYCCNCCQPAIHCHSCSYDGTVCWR